MGDGRDGDGGKCREMVPRSGNCPKNTFNHFLSTNTFSSNVLLTFFLR